MKNTHTRIRTSAEYIKAALLESPGFVHGFSLRRQGVSTGPYASLNFGTATGDSLAHVNANYALLGDTIGIAPARILAVKQVHGTDIMCIDTPAQARALKKKPVEADGIIVSLPGYVAAVKTADCVPIILKASGKQIACAVHAGWRGTVSGIVSQAVQIFMTRYKVKPSLIKASIGPSIGPCCFEVNRETAFNFPPSCRKKSGEKYLVDLWKANALQLEKAGILKRNIHAASLCTYDNEKLFFSHRRDRGITGRMLNWAGWLR